MTSIDSYQLPPLSPISLPPAPISIRIPSRQIPPSTPYISLLDAVSLLRVCTSTRSSTITRIHIPSYLQSNFEIGTVVVFHHLNTQLTENTIFYSPTWCPSDPLLLDVITNMLTNKVIIENNNGITYSTKDILFKNITLLFITSCFITFTIFKASHIVLILLYLTSALLTLHHVFEYNNAHTIIKSLDDLDYIT